MKRKNHIRYREDIFMSKEQTANEVKYKITLKYLGILLRNGLITNEEYEEIDALNRQTFLPQLAKVYV
jgi:hypothetical protein